MPFFLYAPSPPSLSLSLPLTLCCSDEYYPSKPELWRNLLFLAALRCLLIFPFLSTPCVFIAPQSLFLLSLFPFNFFYLIFLPLTYVDLILSHYNDFRFSFTCRPLKPGSSSNAPSFSSEFKQPHKMASIFQSTSCTEMLKQLLCCFCPNLTSRNSVVQQRCYHRHAE